MGGTTPKRPHSPTSGTNPLKHVKDEVIGNERSEEFPENGLSGGEDYVGKVVSSKSSGKMKKRAKVGHGRRKKEDEDGEDEVTITLTGDEDVSTIWKHIQQQEASSKALGAAASSSSSVSQDFAAFQLIKQQQEELDANLARRLAAGDDPFGEDDGIVLSDEYETADEDIDKVPGSKLWEKFPERIFRRGDENDDVEIEAALRRKKEVELDEAFARQLQQEEYGARSSGEFYPPHTSSNESLMNGFQNDSNFSSPRISHEASSDEIAPLRAWWSTITESKRCCKNCGSREAFENVSTVNIRTQLDVQFGIKPAVEKAEKLEEERRKAIEERERERSRMMLYGRFGRGKKLGDSKDEKVNCKEPEAGNGPDTPKQRHDVMERVKILGVATCPKCEVVMCLGCGNKVNVPEEMDGNQDGRVLPRLNSHSRDKRWCCEEGRTVATALILQFLDEQTLNLPPGPYKVGLVSSPDDEDKTSLGAAVKRSLRGIKGTLTDTGSTSTKKSKQSKSPPRFGRGRKPGGYNSKGTGYGGFDEHIIDWDSYEEGEVDFSDEYFEDEPGLMADFSNMFHSSVPPYMYHHKHTFAKPQATSSKGGPASPASAKSPIYVDNNGPVSPSNKLTPPYPMTPVAGKSSSGRGGTVGSPGRGGGAAGLGRGRGMGPPPFSPHYGHFSVGQGKTVGGENPPIVGMPVANHAAASGAATAYYGPYLSGHTIYNNNGIPAAPPINLSPYFPAPLTSPPLVPSSPAQSNHPASSNNQPSTSSQPSSKPSSPHLPQYVSQAVSLLSGIGQTPLFAPTNQLPPGIGVPPEALPPSSVNFLDPGHSPDGYEAPPWKMGSRSPKPLPAAPPLSAKQTRQDLSLTAVLSTLLELLPDAVNEPEYDTEILKVFLRVSTFLEALNELLRNDSIQDVARRSELYGFLLKLLRRVSNEKFMLEVFVEKRKHKKHSIGVLRIAQSPETLPVETEDRPGPRTRRKTAAVAEARKKLEEVLVYKDVETEGWAKSSWEAFERLYKQCHMFLKVVEKSNEKDFQDEEGTRTVGLCGDVVSVRDAIERSIKDTGVMDKADTSEPSETLPSSLRKGKSKAKPENTNPHLSETTVANLTKIIAKEIDHSYHGALAFDYVEGVLTTHYFHGRIVALNESPRGRVLHLTRELATMSTSLPHGVFIRVEENRPDVIKALIVGPSGTPYEGGLYEFDVWAPMEYPNGPPLCQFKTTGNGSVHFNPNLYSCGKVCLSVINTWSGAPSERWQPGLSTLLQVFVSIQSMILCENPWYNEPGRREGTHSKASDDFNTRVRMNNVRWAMLEWLKDPAKRNGIWKDVVNAHFKTNKAYILALVNAWAKKDPGLRMWRNGLGLDTYTGLEVVRRRGLQGPEGVKEDLVVELEKALGGL